MDHLLRSHAPVTDEAWAQIDEEARQRFAPALAARKLVDFSGPHGWGQSATDIGRTTPIDGLEGGLRARLRRVLPLVELRAPFAVSMDELRDAGRGALDIDLGSLDEAVRLVAQAENVAVFHGWAQAGMVGISEASPHPATALGTSYAEYPARVARAVETLLSAGISGPYGLALGPEGYTGVVETTEHGGLVVFDHLRQILGGPIVWAPGVSGAVVVSLRGGDFIFESGQDLAIGFDHHDGELVHLYIEESFSFRATSPDAAVALIP
jgi:uncharacterized linocin/CFP29 family protein